MAAVALAVPCAGNDKAGLLSGSWWGSLIAASGLTDLFTLLIRGSLLTTPPSHSFAQMALFDLGHLFRPSCLFWVLVFEQVIFLILQHELSSWGVRKNEAVVSKQRHIWKSVVSQNSDGDKGVFSFGAQAHEIIHLEFDTECETSLKCKVRRR